MQPEEAGIEFVKAQQCKMCHADTDNGDADPFISWQSGMMSQAARDPVFRATVAIANQDVPGVGEFCFRCHSPRGWLENRSTPPDGSALNREDMHGVSCDVCHRFIDPKQRSPSTTHQAAFAPLATTYQIRWRPRMSTASRCIPSAPLSGPTANGC
jgi:hypothetical protein